MTTTDTLSRLERQAMRHIAYELGSARCEELGIEPQLVTPPDIEPAAVVALVKAIGDISAYCRVAMGHTKTARVSPNEIREIISRAMAEVEGNDEHD